MAHGPQPCVAGVDGSTVRDAALPPLSIDGWAAGMIIICT